MTIAEQAKRLAEAREMMTEVGLLQDARDKLIEEANQNIARANLLSKRTKELINAAQDIIDSVDKEL